LLHLFVSAKCSWSQQSIVLEERENNLETAHETGMLLESMGTCLYLILWCQRVVY